MPNEAKHTPGPWKVRLDKHIGKVPTAVEGSDGKAICQFTWTTHQNSSSYFYDAALIAAAPELLKQLKDLVRCIRSNELGDYSPLMDEILDSEHAIRQAEGL